MAWAPNWWERREAILRHGLPAVVLGARITDGFVALYFDIDDSLLLRSHEARGLPLHLTLGYTSDYGDVWRRPLLSASTSAMLGSG